jgi:alpha-beta hydrolase superfamily lysophospholipase
VKVAAVPAADGVLLHHRIWTAADAPSFSAGRHPRPGPRAAVVAFNGIMSHSAWMEPLAVELAERGISLIGADRRGTGLSDSPRGDAPSADVLIDDAARIIRSVEQRPLLLLGWCWGANLALNVVKQVDARGLILIAPGLWPTDAVQAAARAATEAARDLAEDQPGVATPVAEELFTRGPALESFIMKDELRLRAMTPRFRRIMDRLLIHALATLRRLDVPLLAILANDDEATDSDVAARALSRLDPASTTISRMPGPHGLIFERPGELADAIVPWIDGLRAP